MRKLTIAGPFSGITLSKQLAFCLLIGGLVMAQAIGIIYTKQNKRALHATLQTLNSTRDKLQVEWSRLLLEEGTWEADARVEYIAREKLGMIMPDKVNVLIP